MREGRINIKWNLKINSLTRETLTCGELLDKSIKLAIALKKLSVQKGDVVALISENSFICYIVSCAALYCGAMFQPLNFTYTLVELKHVFGITSPKIVFSSKTAINNVLHLKKEFGCIQTIILTDDDHRNKLIESVKSSDGFEPSIGSVTDTAFLCLSSGTSGLPKCVEISNQTTIPIMNYSYDYFDITSKDTTVLVLPFFHSYGLILHLTAITNSLIVIIMKSFQPDLYLQCIEEYKVTKLFLVPPLLSYLVKSPVVSKYNFTSVQDIIIAAAPLSNDLYQEALHKFSHCSIRQFYGSTEIGGLCTIQPSTSSFANVGQVVCNTTVKIVNTKTKAILGPYHEGEICVKSASVMKSYFNNPIETKNSFDADGFYCSGDIGYYDKDKCFYVVDRLKELIKYKGFQVAPAELENLLITHPGIKDCGVVGIEDEICGQLPLAFVVREEGSKVTEQEIIKYVEENMSIQKQLHGGVRFIGEIPRSLAGKILRKELIQVLYKNKY